MKSSWNFSSLLIQALCFKDKHPQSAYMCINMSISTWLEWGLCLLLARCHSEMWYQSSVMIQNWLNKFWIAFLNSQISYLRLSHLRFHCETQFVKPSFWNRPRDSSCVVFVIPCSCVLFVVFGPDLLVLKDEQNPKCFSRTQWDGICFFQTADNRTYDLFYNADKYVIHRTFTVFCISCYYC